MAKYYGYCYDENGKFTEMIPIDEKPIYEKRTFYREEQKEVVTEEKLCALDRKSTRLNSSHRCTSRMPSSA